MNVFEWARSFHVTKDTGSLAFRAAKAGNVPLWLLNDAEATELIGRLTAVLAETKSEAIVRAGVLVFVNLRDRDGQFSTLAKALSEQEMDLLKREPHLLSAPTALAQRLYLTPEHTVAALINPTSA